MQNIPYYQHDNDMRNDPKIIALRNKFKLEGYAVYCMTLEALTDNKNNKIEFNDLNLELLAGDFRVETQLLKQIYEYCFVLNLFQKDEFNFMVCEELNSRLTPLLEKRAKWREAKQKLKTDEKNTFSTEKNETSTEKNKFSSENARKVKVKVKVKDKKDIKEINKEKKSTNFIPPTIEEIKAFCLEKNYPDYSEHFFNYHNQKDWLITGIKMKRWKSAVNVWHINAEKFRGNGNGRNNKSSTYENRVNFKSTQQQRDERNKELADMFGND